MMDGDDDSRPDAEAERVKRKAERVKRKPKGAHAFIDCGSIEATESPKRVKEEGEQAHILHVVPGTNVDCDSLLFVESESRERVKKERERELRKIRWSKIQALPIFLKIKPFVSLNIKPPVSLNIKPPVSPEIESLYKLNYELNPESYDSDKLVGLFEDFNKLAELLGGIDASYHSKIEVDIESFLRNRGIEYEKIEEGIESFLRKQHIAYDKTEEDIDSLLRRRIAVWKAEFKNIPLPDDKSPDGKALPTKNGNKYKKEYFGKDLLYPRVYHLYGGDTFKACIEVDRWAYPEPLSERLTPPKDLFPSLRGTRRASCSF